MKSLLSRKWAIASFVGVGSVLLVGALLLTGVLPGLTRPAHASAADAGGGVCDLSARHSVCTGRSVGAHANFYKDDGCISTDVGVDAFQDVSHSETDPSSSTSQVLVYLYQYDTCAFNQIASGYGQAVGVNFQGDAQLNGATLTATVPITGDGVPDGYTLTITLTWHGVGDTRVMNDDFKYRSPTGMTITRYAMNLRSAVAMGTVTDGTTNFASDPALNSTLSDNNGKQIVIDRP